MRSVLLTGIAIVLLFLAACGPTSTATPVVMLADPSPSAEPSTTPTPDVPTMTSTFTPTATPTPTPTPTPTHTSTPTATPTATSSPVPLVDMEGMLFFDHNGSGLREDHEPIIPGFGVCAAVRGQEEICVSTDTNGIYRFRDLAPRVTRVSLSFVDPNEADPQLAFRFISYWRGPITIEAYEFDGVQVPEQHLNDTEVRPFWRGVPASVGVYQETGLMQGFLTMPFKAVDANKVGTVLGFDHDPRVGHVIDYKGDTTFCPEPPGCPSDVAVGDTHVGWDYGFPVGTILIAQCPGLMETWINTDTNGAVNLWILPGLSWYRS